MRSLKREKKESLNKVGLNSHKYLQHWTLTTFCLKILLSCFGKSSSRLALQQCMAPEQDWSKSYPWPGPSKCLYFWGTQTTDHRKRSAILCKLNCWWDCSATDKRGFSPGKCRDHDSNDPCLSPAHKQSDKFSIMQTTSTTYGSEIVKILCYVSSSAPFRPWENSTENYPNRLHNMSKRRKTVRVKFETFKAIETFCSILDYCIRALCPVGECNDESLASTSLHVLQHSFHADTDVGDSLPRVHWCYSHGEIWSWIIPEFAFIEW